MFESDEVLPNVSKFELKQEHLGVLIIIVIAALLAFRWWSSKRVRQAQQMHQYRPSYSY